MNEDLDIMNQEELLRKWHESLVTDMDGLIERDKAVSAKEQNVKTGEVAVVQWEGQRSQSLTNLILIFV